MFNGMFGVIKQIAYKTKGGAWRPFGVDLATWALNIIDYAHHEIHSGSSFFVYENAVLGNGNVLDIAITTPNTTKWSHLILHLDVSAGCVFDMLEDVTSFAGGAATIPANRNRNSTNVSVNTCLNGNTITADAIVPTGGTAVWNESVGVRGIVWSRSSGEEIILKQNSNYLFRVTNGANANTVTMLLNWYEHTDRN